MPQRIQQLRLAAVKNLGVMDDGRSQTAYDRMARLAKCIFGSEIALITFMDGERQWFKSHIGIDKSENTPEQSFCSYTIAGGTVLVVEDSREDSRFSHLAGHFDKDEKRRNLQLEAAARVRLQAEIDQIASGGGLNRHEQAE